MTGWTCRRFRARFAPGLEDAHRRHCRVCAEYAAALERAAARRVPLPDRLRARLESIPARPAGDPKVVKLPLPEVPMPDRLRGRLRGIAREARVERTLPDWIRSPRYAIAASYLLAALIYAAFGNPVEPLERVASSLASEGRERLEVLEAETSQTYGETRRVFETSLQSLGSEVTELSDKIESTLERRP